MTPRTFKIVALALVVLAIALGVVWKVAASRDVGPRIGVDVPMRGM